MHSNGVPFGKCFTDNSVKEKPLCSVSQASSVMSGIDRLSPCTVSRNESPVYKSEIIYSFLSKRSHPILVSEILKPP
jgi:hypothetical protein